MHARHRARNLLSPERYDIITANEEVHYGLLPRRFLLPKFLITVAPVTRDKEICQSYVMMR